MSNIVVIVYDDETRANIVRQSISQAQGHGYISLDDSAVLEKNAEGKVHVHNELDRGIKVGAAGGSMLGLFIGAMFGGPIGVMIVGGLSGAFVGKLADKGISKKFVEQVAEELKPGTSALFFIVRDANPDYAVAAVRQYGGSLYHTSLPKEAEDELRGALERGERLRKAEAAKAAEAASAESSDE
jgi:uncharacterized membrane protein